MKAAWLFGTVRRPASAGRGLAGGRGLVIVCGLLALAAPWCEALPGRTAPSETKAQSLYKRLGGYDMLADMTDELIRRMQVDPQLYDFFKAASTDAKNRFRQLVLDQFCAATGGPCVYLGREMKVAHEGTLIGESHWLAGLKQLDATLALERFNVGPKERAEVRAVIAGLKADVVAHK